MYENLRFDDFQMGLLRDRYLLPGESPGDMFKRVAKAVKVPASEKLMRTGLFLPNSPTLYNAGTPLGQLSACFFLPVEDSMESIFGTLRDTALIHKSGGGTGFNFSKLRPAGDRVSSTGGVASGAISFMRVYDAGTEAVTQGGKRRGANMGMLNDDHPEILDFITCKEGDMGLQNFNLSVSITDEFMKAHQRGKDWSLINPRTGDVWDTIGADDIWQMMIYQAWNKGDPGFYFKTQVEKHNPHPELGELPGCNPCVTGDTLILTKEGYRRIDELVGQKVFVWNGEEFSEVVPEITGENQPTIYLEFSNGHAIRCTPYHGFLLKDGTRVEAKDLRVLDQLARWEYPVIEGTKKASEKLMYTKGFFSGDGTKLDRRCSIRLYGSKRDLNLEQFMLYTHASYREEFTNLELDRDTGFEKEWVPGVEYTVQARLDWLAGLMDSDGGSSGHGIYISSVNLGFLQQVQYMCETLGCRAILSEGKSPCMKEFKGKEYPCQQEYRLVFNWWEMSKLVELGFRTHRVRVPEGKPLRDNSHYVTCTFKEDSGIEEKVYCFTEPLKHMGVFNGLRTFNCGETPLRDNESCNLGSINLSRMVEGDEFDWDLMETVIRTSVEFLNNVVDENVYPLPQIKEATLETRKIGLGVMGWADALIKMGLRYDEAETLDVAEKTMKFIQTISHDQSNGRNATVTTIAPTGSISILANCSSGIEPNFGVYEVREQAGRTYHRKHPLIGQYDEELFRLSHDISPEYHIYHQATFQRFTDNAISKTINMPSEATVEMVGYAVDLAHKLECKGVTIYRDKSKKKQVITQECEKCRA